MRKRVFSITFGLIGLLLLIFSLETTITGNVIVDVTGVNTTSRLIGGAGILLMLLAVVIENYELNKIKLRKKQKNSKNK